MLEPLARLGYASKATVYGIVGVLAILTVVNRGGEVTDTSGALELVLAQPFGRILLTVLAVGLCGYALWRFLDAIGDPDREGTGPHGVVTRVGNVVRGGVYGALGIEAFRMIRGMGGAAGDDTELLTARILNLPFGDVLVAVAGATIAIYGISEVVKGARGNHDAKLDWSPIPSAVRGPIQQISRFGVAIRGALLTTLGLFLVRAAFTHDSSDAAGQQESMLRLGGLFAGRWFLAFIAIGVIAYAVDQAVHARCRRIRPVM